MLFIRDKPYIILAEISLFNPPFFYLIPSGSNIFVNFHHLGLQQLMCSGRGVQVGGGGGGGNKTTKRVKYGKSEVPETSTHKLKYRPDHYKWRVLCKIKYLFLVTNL